MGVVGGAVQGVDYPAGVALTLLLPALLGKQPVVREGLPQDLPNLPLGLFVGLGDEVRLPLVLDPVLPAEAVSQHLAGCLRCRDRHLKLPRQVFSFLP